MFSLVFNFYGKSFRVLAEYFLESGSESWRFYYANQLNVQGTRALVRDRESH